MIVALSPLSAHASSADSSDSDALALADAAPTAVQKAKDWQMFIEGAVGDENRRGTSDSQYNERLSLDVQYDKSFASAWRAVFADRLDIDWPAQTGDQHAINTLKEAYLSWHEQPNTIFDLGRINQRFGVATAYNPTDYFRDGSVRSIVSIDPFSLKENREGSVMLRGQRLWDSGSITALYSPELTSQASTNGFNPDWGGTNNHNRWVLTLSQKLAANFDPQLLVYKEASQPVQFGLDLTEVLNHATVFYVEWSGGRSESLLTRSLKQVGISPPDDTEFRHHLSTGITYTTPINISLTTEFEYDGGGLDQAAWRSLQNGSTEIYGLYRNFVQTAQDLPTKRTVFLYATWQNALIYNLDLSAMENYDVVDSSHRSWLEALYHVGHCEYELQWQLNNGSGLSDYGASSQTRSIQLLARYYY